MLALCNCLSQVFIGGIQKLCLCASYTPMLVSDYGAVGRSCQILDIK